MDKRSLIAFIMAAAIIFTAGAVEKESKERKEDAKQGAKTEGKHNLAVDTTEAKTSFYADEPVMVHGNKSWDLKFPIDPGTEHIYGISYEARGTEGANLQPQFYKTLCADGTERQSRTWINHQYGSFRIDTSDSWQKGKIEVFTKKGAAFLVMTFGVNTGGKEGKVQVRNVCLKEGGFPDWQPVPGAPYLGWINSLKANREYAKANPLLDINDKNDAGIFCQWTRHIKLPFVRLPNDQSRNTLFSDMGLLLEQVKPFMEVPVKTLIDSMPNRRPAYIGGKYYIYILEDYAKRNYRWDPRTPDVLYKSDGSVFDVEKEYPITGYEEVTAPSGEVFKYAYHDPGNNKDKKNKLKDRIYLDDFTSTARINELCRAGHVMAALYRKTGDMEYAKRSAAILWAWSRSVPHWPMCASDANSKNEMMTPHYFRPPDTYEDTFTFITGAWYYSAFGSFATLARHYDLIREAPVWEELSKTTGRDAQKDIEDGFLHVVKMALKIDAYYRTNPWVVYHNMIGTEINGFIEIGRAIGCPELLHYSLRKAEGAMNYYYMADGCSYECPHYHQMMTKSLQSAFDKAEGYADPPGYVASIDGAHIESYDLRKLFPIYNRAWKFWERATFPDGGMLTVHDSLAEEIYPHRIENPREKGSPFLFSEYGHAILGRGEKPYSIEAHLHFSGNYNHVHEDMLSLILWAYGDELVPDLGYCIWGGQYNGNTVAHNLVMVDGSAQNHYTPPIPKGDLIAWYPRPDASQAAQASGAHAYKKEKVDKYRRSIILVPFAPGQDAIIDIFEVEGGAKRHEWMANGCADYPQEIETDLKTIKELDNLAKDGKPFTLKEGEFPPADKEGEMTHYYGAFRNVRVCENRVPWQVTMKAGKPVPEDTPWAGARAKSKKDKPGLRLHWLNPDDGQVFLCEAPRERYFNIWSSEESQKGALAEFTKNLMRKVIVRREGKKSSIFVALWEPFIQTPWIKKQELLKEIPAKEGLGLKFESETEKAIVIYRMPESKAVLKAQGITANASFTVMREMHDECALDLYGGTDVSTGDMKVELSTYRDLRVVSLKEKDKKYYLLVEGNLEGYPSEPENQPHAGEFVKFKQPGSESRWLPLEYIKKNGKESCLFLAYDPGFTFDAERKSLREHFRPFRSLHGEAKVDLPSWVNLKWKKNKEIIEKLSVHSSGDVRIHLTGYKDMDRVKVQSALSEEITEIPVKKTEDGILIELSPNTLGLGWWDILLGDS